MPGSIGTQAVLQHHVAALHDDIESLMEDYTESSVLITPRDTFQGIQEIREFFEAFLSGLPRGALEAFQLRRQETAGELGYLTWEARPWIDLATDTLLVRDGKIVLETLDAHQSASA